MSDVTLSIWVFTIMYCLGFALLDTLIESSEEENPNADIKLALLWPYVAVRVIIDRLMYGKDEGED